MKTKWIWVVDVDEAAIFRRADQLIQHALKNELGTWTPQKTETVFTRNQLQKLIELGAIQVDQKKIASRTLIQSGQTIEIYIEEKTSPLEADHSTELEILFEDNDIVVINKPAGLTTHPSPTQTEGTLVHVLLSKIKKLSSVGGPLRPGIVHRLDKNTSGVMVVSKSDTAHHVLTETFSKHDIERKYWALVFGAPAFSANHTVETQIGRNPKDRKKMAVLSKGGKPATTHLTLLEKFGTPAPYASWVEAKLETGRTHQVRVHLTHIGHSLLGDPTYGVPTSNTHKWKILPQNIRNLIGELPGQALHARSLGFTHPTTQKKLYFEAEPPTAFQNLLKAMRS